MPLHLVPPGQRKKRVGKRVYRNPCYLVRGEVDGREFEVSTKTRDKVAAERFKAELELKILDRRVPQSGEAVTFAKATDLYIAFRDPREVDRKRIAKARRHLGKRVLDGITHADLVAMANLFHPRGSAATKNRETLRPVAAIMHYASSLTLCPWLRVPLFREKRPATRAVSRDIATVLIANAPGDEERLFLAWVFRQGDRISDALRVEEAHIDMQRQTVRSYVSKTDEWIVRPLHEDVLTVLANLNRAETVKQRRRRGKHLFRWRTKSGVYKWLRPMCRKLGISFTPHMARHSMATWHVDEGTDLKTVMEAGGWRDIKSVARYAAAGVERVRAAGQKLGKLVGERS